MSGGGEGEVCWRWEGPVSEEHGLPSTVRAVAWLKAGRTMEWV